KYYNKEGSTDIKHIYLPAQAGMGDTLIASVKGTGTSAVVSYIHTDHLGSTDKVTNTNAEISELSDYYPYGSPRISTTFSGSSEQRKYTGHEFDSQTELTYANARYYNGNTARFLSQDPIYLLVGSKKFEDKWKKNWRDVKEGKNSALNEYLSNPQNLNSYSYALNNPLKYTDPTGESAFWEEVFNFAAGRGFKTDAQVTGSDKNQFGLPNSYLTAPKNESNNQKQSEDYITRPGHEPDSYLSRGNEIGPSQEARYKVAGKIDNFSTALDAYSEVDNIPAASATIVSAVAAIPYVGQTTVAIATVAIGASFIVSNFISSGLNAVAEDIRN
ncbi:MAG: RHS repeat-associated core domain-containing protein, partial [Patescibacteria group bacterium]